ncbi:MAG: acylneuraminate cytidylyltransferase family protein [Lachnospiraceae bacterium]|nr:acylneuraminate cytidylyltransferase family protein [Lachnospiraceae bacterium]
MDILAIIPARGGSKGIPHKNIVPLCGKPLIQYTIEAAVGCKYLTKITVNSDDDEILKAAEYPGVELIHRPEELAQDSTPMKDVIMHELTFLQETQGYEPDFLVLLQPTSPLRTAKHLNEALELLLHSDGDALVSVEDEPHLHSPYSVMRKNEEGYLEFFLKEGMKFTDRKQKPKFYARNGAAIYAVRTKTYLETGCLYGSKCLPYLMRREESIDIDEPLDLYLAECLLRYRDQGNVFN